METHTYNVKLLLIFLKKNSYKPKLTINVIIVLPDKISSDIINSTNFTI